MIVIHATARPINVRGCWPIACCGALTAEDFQAMHNDHAPRMALTDCIWWVPGTIEP